MPMYFSCLPSGQTQPKLLSHRLRCTGKRRIRTVVSALDQCWVCQHSITQSRVRHSCNHRYLDRGHDFSRPDTESCEAENALAIRLNQSLHEASRLTERSRAKIGVHRNAKQPISNVPGLRFLLT